MSHFDPQALGKVARPDGRHVGRARGLAHVGQRRAEGAAVAAASTPTPSIRPSATWRNCKREGFERCFIALHGRFGEDGTVQGALELLGIPYTGSGVMASSIAIDKVMTKRVWLAEGLPTPKYVLPAPWRLHSREQVHAVPDDLGLPLIVKPAREGSSIGVAKVQGYSRNAGRGGRSRPRYDADVLCEQFIAGDEVTCPVLGTGRRCARAAGDPHRRARRQLRLPEQVLHRRHQVPGARAACPKARSRRSRTSCWQAYRVLGCRGWGRVDVMIDASDAQALPAGDQHLARHDRPFAGADVGARGRHQLRRPVPAAAGSAALDSGGGSRA